MPTVKISDLPVISTINGNTAATIIPVVDISTDETARITVRTLADGLFHNDSLKVGPNEILLANTVAQFTGNSETFLQTNLQNLRANGSADYVATADIGTNANNYVDLGINNSTYNDPEYSATKALDGYLYVSGSLDNSTNGNLVIGTASTGANVLFIAGGTTTENVIAKITKFGITLNNSSRLEFTDGSIQTVAAAPASLSQGAYDTANSASSNTIIIQGVNITQNNNITSVNQYAQSAFATANDVNGYAISAYATANGANGLAAGAFATANGANGLAAGAYNTANAVNGYAVSAFATANGANGLAAGAYNTANAVNTYAQSAYATANGANGLAAGAYNTANGANGLAAGAFITANGANGLAAGAFNKANNALANTFSITVNNSIYIPGSLVVDGLVFANGASYVANVMSIPTTYASPQTAITLNYQQANIVKTNITSDLIVSHSNIVLGKFIDLFVYNDSATTQTITHGISANNSTTKGTTIKVAPYNTKHLKYFTIDSDLANTYVIETASENYNNEDVYFAGDLTMNGTVTVANTNFATSEAAFRITAAGSSQTPTQAGTLMQLTNKPNVPARVLIDSFGTSNSSYSIIAGRAARGTVDAPTATQNNDILLRIAGNSYGTTGYAPFGDARIDFVATENHSDTARGSRIRFWNTPNGSNVVNEIASFNADSVYFTGTVAPEKGFIYSPTMLVGNQTAITIDFATTSLIKAELIADLTISFTNYQYGKVVEVWLTNTGGNPRTITHGCSALNSTINATTFTMSATSSAYLRYFSINGDLANTFVSVQNA
jgi:hypothetical protein